MIAGPIYMNKNHKPSEAELAKGQVWRTEDAYLQIMDRGKRLISYKVMKELGKRGVRTQMSGIGDVEAYLKANDAELIEKAA
jgi:hypothetical protein